MLLPGSQIRRLREEAPSNFATLLYKVVNNHDGDSEEELCEYCVEDDDENLGALFITSNFATLLYKVVPDHDDIVYSFERGWSWCFFANLFYKDVPDHDDNVEVDVKCGTFLCHPDYMRPLL